jgi:hypothetical protein
MNERIRELADEAKMSTYLLAYGLEFNISIEKFAELIVKECLDIVNRHEYSYHEADPLWETAQLIKERFGVAE